MSSNLTTVSFVTFRYPDVGARGNVLNQRDVARLAQLVERKALNLVVVGSSPTVGIILCLVDARISRFVYTEDSA